MLRLTKGRNTPCALPFMISINNNNKSDITLKVTPLDSMKQIKEKLADKIKTYPEHQALEYENKRLNDDDTVFDCRMEHGSVLNAISNSFKINVVLSRRETFCVVVRSNNTVRYVKCAITTCKGIQLNEHKLRFNGKELEDYATLYDCGIKANSALELVFKRDPITIHLRTEGRPTCTLKVQTNVRIEAVEKKMGLNPEKYLWLFESKVLSGDQRQSTLHDCGITNNAVIDVIPYELLYETLESQHTHESAMLKDEWRDFDDEDPGQISGTQSITSIPGEPGLDAYAPWLLQLTQHMNAFDDIYNENELKLSAFPDLHEQIATARESFNAITERIVKSPKELTPSPPTPPPLAYNLVTNAMQWVVNEESTPTPLLPLPEPEQKWVLPECHLFMDQMYDTPPGQDSDASVRNQCSNTQLRADAKEFIYSPHTAQNNVYNAERCITSSIQRFEAESFGNDASFINIDYSPSYGLPQSTPHNVDTYDDTFSDVASFEMNNYGFSP